MHWKTRREHFQILDMHALHHVLQCSADFQSHLQLKLLNSVHQRVKIQQSHTTNRICSCMVELKKQSFTAGKKSAINWDFFHPSLMEWLECTAVHSLIHASDKRARCVSLAHLQLKALPSYCFWQPLCRSPQLAYCSDAASPTAEHTEVYAR